MGTPKSESLTEPVSGTVPSTAVAGNASLRAALAAAIAGTRLESRVIEARMRDDAEAVALAQRREKLRRKRARYRAKRAAARREVIKQASL
jgi:hypothetical protein